MLDMDAINSRLSKAEKRITELGNHVWLLDTRIGSLSKSEIDQRDLHIQKHLEKIENNMMVLVGFVLVGTVAVVIKSRMN